MNINAIYLALNIEPVCIIYKEGHPMFTVRIGGNAMISLYKISKYIAFTQALPEKSYFQHDNVPKL